MTNLFFFSLFNLLNKLALYPAFRAKLRLLVSWPSSILHYRNQTMKATIHLLEPATLWCGILIAISALPAPGQTLINLGTQGRNIDFSNAPSTRPEKTGLSLPATCLPGQLFFNLAAIAGQNLDACVANNTWSVMGTGSASGLADPGQNGLIVRTAQNTTTAVAAPNGTVVGTSDTQTLTNKSINASEINSGTLSSAQMPALSGDLSTSPGSTVTSLAPINSNPGIYGDSSHSVQLAVDGKGRVTGITQVSISSSTSSSASITSGALASLQNTCPVGSLYFATDQPAGQQLYTCSSANIWTQMVALGSSGALAFNNGSMDIVTSVVPRLTAANSFSGLNAFSNGVQLTSPTTATQPTCSSTTRGLFWFQNNNTSKDGLQVCVYTGTSFFWNSLY